MYKYKTQNHGNYIIVTILHKKHCSYTSSSAFSGRSSSVGKYSVNSARTGALVVYDQRIEGLRQDVRPNTSIVHPYKNGPCQIYTLIDIKNKLKATLEQFFLSVSKLIISTPEYSKEEVFSFQLVCD